MSNEMIEKVNIIITSGNLWLLVFIVVSIIVGIVLNFVPFIVAMAIIAMIFGAALLLYYPFLGALAYLIFEYASLAAQYHALQALSLGKIIAIVTFLIWIFHSIVKGKLVLVHNHINKLMLAWLIIAILSIFGAMDSTRAFFSANDFSKWVLIYFMLVNIIDSKAKWQWFVAIFLLLNFKMSQFQIRAFSAGLSAADDSSHFIREGLGAGSAAYFGNAGDFGVAMCVIAPLALFAFLTVKSKIWKTVSAGMFIAFVLSIIKSGARGNLLGLVAIGLGFMLKSSQKLLVGFAIAALLVVYWVTAPDIVRNRFEAATSSEKDETSTHRLQLWGTGIQMLLEHPVLGVGIGNFSVEYANRLFGGESRQKWVPHNIFIQVSSELGFSGLICFLMILYFLFKTNKQTRDIAKRAPPDSQTFTNFAHALDLSIIGYIVSGSFLSVLYYPHLYMLMALTVSLNHIAQKNLINDDIQREVSTVGAQGLVQSKGIQL
jgi:putative inorganic carbon (hco3(-)) transporter